MRSMAWVALYHVFDGLQSVCLFVLRCFKVVLLPFLSVEQVLPP